MDYSHCLYIMEGYARRQVRKQLKLVPEQWSLSQAIQGNPQTCDEKRISLVGKSVGRLDAVPEQFKLVESLYLSNNLITDLQGLTQFPRLKSLSIGGNRVEAVGQLIGLKALMRLENLSIEGNPVCGIAGVREFLVSGLSSLRTLDGKEITAAERDRAKAFTQQIESLETLAVLNEEHIAVLQHLLKTLKLHKELILKKGLETYEGMEVRKFVERYEAVWPTGLQDQVKAGLRAKAREVAGEQLDPGALGAAYSECIQTQQELIARMAAACEDQAKACKSLWTFPSERPKKPPTPQARPIPPTQTYAFRFDGVSPTSQRSPKDYTDVQTRYHSLIHPTRSHSNASSRSNSVLKLAAEEERPQQLRAPVQDSEKPKKWTEEGNMLEEQNKALRAKLREFEETNRANVQLAETELNRMNEQLRATMRENERLKESGKGAKSQFREVATRSEDEVFPQAILKYHRTKQLRKTIRWLQTVTRQSSAIAGFSRGRQLRKNTEVALLCLAAWKWMAKTEKYVRYKSEHRVETLADDFLVQLHTTAFQARKLREMHTQRCYRIQKHCLEVLAAYPKQREERSTAKRVADSMRTMNLLYWTFAGWSEALQSGKMTETERIHLLRTADIGNRTRLLKGLWSSWTAWHREEGGPKRHKQLLAYSHYADFLRKRLLTLLLNSLQRSQNLQLSAQVMAKMRLRQAQQVCIKALRRYIRLCRAKRNVYTRASLFRRIQLFQRLRNALSVLHFRRNKAITATHFHTSTLFRRVFTAYSDLSRKRRQLLDTSRTYIESRNRRISHLVLQKWLIELWRGTDRPGLHALRRVFQTWLRLSVGRKVSKLRNRLGNHLYVRAFQSRLKTLVRAWRLLPKSRRQLTGVAKEMQRRRGRALALRCFGDWRNAYMCAILGKIEGHKSSAEETAGSLAEAKLRLAEAEEANAELRRQVDFAAAQLQAVSSAKAGLDSQLRAFQLTGQEASGLISRLERDFAAASAHIAQLQADKETLAQNCEQKVDLLREELRQREKDLREAEQALIHAADFKREMAETTDEHVQEVVSANDNLVEQLQAKERELWETNRQNLQLAEELRRKDARLAEVRAQASPKRHYNVDLRSPASPKPPANLDIEPVRMTDEDQIKDQLMTLKQERAAIREEIETRMRRAEGPRRSSSHSDTHLLDISSRMASLEARLASRLK